MAFSGSERFSTWKYSSAFFTPREVSVAVRPEKVDVHESEPPRGTRATENVVVGKVRDIAYLGDVSIYRVETEAGAIVRVQETHVERSSEPHYDWDDTLWLSWEAASAVVLTT